MSYNMDVDNIDSSKRGHYWMPLWRNNRPKSVLQAEKDSIIRIAIALKIPRDNIETVLNIEGDKTLRIKIFKTKDNCIDVFDYYFFCPMIIENERMCMRAMEKIQSFEKDEIQHKIVVKILNENDIIKKISETVGRKSA